MTVAKSFLKISDFEAVVKVTGVNADTTTITLNSDLLHAPTQVVDGSTQTVDITGMAWTGAANGVIQIVRDSVIITTLQAGAAGYLEFTGQYMTPDTTKNTKDIVVTITGGQAELWLRVRKTDGYKSTIEDGWYGSYDDPAIIGPRA